MTSQDGVPVLPPLIDFGEDDITSSSLTNVEAFCHTSSSPFRDPFDVFESSSISPAGSSSSPFNAKQWDLPHSGSQSSSSPFFNEHWNNTFMNFNGVIDFSTGESSGLGICPNSEKYTNIGGPYRGKESYSDVSPASVSHPQIDLLSSPDIMSSPQMSGSRSSQTPPVDQFPQQALGFMSPYSLNVGDSSFFNNVDSPYDSSSWLNKASSDCTSNAGLALTKDSFSRMSLGVNDFDEPRSGPLFPPIKDQMHVTTQSLSSQNTTTTSRKAADADLLEDANFGMAFEFVEQPASDRVAFSQTGTCEKQQAIVDRDNLPSEMEVNPQHSFFPEGQDRSSQHCVRLEENSSLHRYDLACDDHQSHQLNTKNYFHTHQDAGKHEVLSQQKMATILESNGSIIGGLKEFVSGGGGKGFFKSPERGADMPVSFELRPQPLKEALIPATRVLACTDTTLWLGCDEGILVWDIPSSVRSSCDGKDNMKGDEDAAAYCKYVQGLAPTCLFADSANQVMWSGHKDGKIRAWALSIESDKNNNGNGSTSVLTWQAHQTPVLAIVVTSYGELWTGADNGSLRAWPRNAVAPAFSSPAESMHVVDASRYVDLKARGLAAGVSSLATLDVRFLIVEHSHCRVWSGGSHFLALWDARTKDVLKVFGPNVDAEFTSPNISPVRETGKGEELKLNVTRALKKEKSQGSLSFFQRSRNAVIGAADAVLRAAVGSQIMDDSKKMEALVCAADGNVWVGYASGRLIQWDSFGNWLAEHRHSYTAVRCMCSFGNRIFVGYADGAVHALAMDSGKLLGAWRAHKSSVARMGVCANHLFSLADNGGLRGLFINSPSTLDKSLHLRMTLKESTYIRLENIKILAATWNVGQEKASFTSLTSWLEQGSVQGSIIVVGLQEVEMGAGALAMAAAKETVGLAGSVNGQWWLESIGDILNGTKQFERVGSRQLAGLLIGVWVSKEILPYVGGVDVGAVPCGFGRAFGNKGAVAVKMMVFRRIVCVVNCHFAAHMDAVVKRNADFDHIYNRMVFGRSAGVVGLAATAMAASAVQIIRGNSNRQDTSSMEYQDFLTEKDNESGDFVAPVPELSEADLLIWVGDFNYRLADLSYVDALELICDKNWEELLKKDQLRLEMKAGKVFQGMREAYIMFSPTYKFDKGCTASNSEELHYDSSEKKRIPAWCDRVVYRDSFDGSDCERNPGLSRPMAASALWYRSCMDAVESDHKPVSCLLDVQVAVINEAARRWEYGKFFRTDPEALAVLKQIEMVPESGVHTSEVTLVDRTISTLKLSNRSLEKWAVFSFHSEGEPRGLSSQNQMIERKDRPCNFLPKWLQVVPAAGVLHPGQTLEVIVQYVVPSEDESSSKGALDSRHRKTASLVVQVKGLFSSSSRQHQVTVSHSFSTSFDDQHVDYSNYSQREINYR